METEKNPPEPKRRRGRKKNPKGSLTPSEQRLLSFIALSTAREGGACCTKKHLSIELGCNVKTIDRGIMRLRREGLIEVEARHLPNGGQTANMYRLVGRGAADSAAESYQI